MQKCCLRVKSPIDLKMLNDFQNVQRFSDFLQCQQSPEIRRLGSLCVLQGKTQDQKSLILAQVHRGNNTS